MTVNAAIANGSPSRNRRSRRKTDGALRAMPGQVNSPDRKKNIAMKKLSVASTTMSKPIQEVGSV